MPKIPNLRERTIFHHNCFYPAWHIRRIHSPSNDSHVQGAVPATRPLSDTCCLWHIKSVKIAPFLLTPLNNIVSSFLNWYQFFHPNLLLFLYFILFLFCVTFPHLIAKGWNSCDVSTHSSFIWLTFINNWLSLLIITLAIKADHM